MSAFAEWMKKVGLRPHDVAEAWGVQDSAIWKLTHRAASRLSDKNLLRVWLFTGGEVRLDPTRKIGFYPAKARAKTSAEHQAALSAIRMAEERRQRRLTEKPPLTEQQQQLRQRDTEIYARWRAVRNFSQVGREYGLTFERVRQIIKRERIDNAERKKKRKPRAAAGRAEQRPE